MASLTLEERIARRANFSRRFREDIDRDSGEADGIENLRLTTWSLITSSSRRCTIWGTTQPIELIEWDCQDLWYTFIRAAKYTAHDSPSQDRLVVQIIYARQMGPLSRLSDGTPAETSDGVIWTDLPYLVGHLKDAWRNSYTLELENRLNLAAFIARLIGLGVKSEELSICALWTFRDALEIQLSETDNEEKSNQRMYELLSVLDQWLRYAGRQLVLQLKPTESSLPALSDNFEDPDSSDPQGLALEAGIHQAGFHVERWKFWRERLHLLSKSTSSEISEKAKRGAHMMYQHGFQVCSALKETYDTSSPFLNIKRVEKAGT